MKIITAWKPEGITPYQLVSQIKENEKYKDLKLGFAGRLDPMAEGVMIFLVGDENKKRKDYEKLPKIYEFEILFGISSDTYDILGIPKLYSSVNLSNEKLEKIATSFLGKQIQKYPPYSYPRIKGKSLHWWARNNRLSEIKIPEKEVEIYFSKYLSSRTITASELIEDVKKRVSKVDGDFRQEETLKAWDDLDIEKKALFQIAKFRIECKSGTYVRAIANDVGVRLGNGALAYKITRKAVGNFNQKSVVLMLE